MRQLIASTCEAIAAGGRFEEASRAKEALVGLRAYHLANRYIRRVKIFRTYRFVAICCLDEMDR